MDQQGFNPEEIEISWSEEQQAPETLLSQVLGRLAERQPYLEKGLAANQQHAGLQHSAWEIRAATVRTFDGNTDPELLKAALADEHRLVRVAALRVLGQLGEQAPLEYLLQALADPEWEVREMVILTLAEINIQTSDLLGSLLQVAQKDPYAPVREAAQYVLAKNKKEYAQPSIASSNHRQVEVDTTRSAQQILCETLITITKRYSVLFIRQIPLIHKSIWLGAVLVTTLGMIMTLYSLASQPSNMQAAGVYMAMFITISAGAGAAFLFGGENDSGLELTLSTPTSIRIMMLFRFLIVVGYNLLVALIASGVVALIYGGNLWEIIHLWLEPLLLVALTTFSMSVLISSWLALLVTFGIEALHVFELQLNNLQLNFNFFMHMNWDNNPYLFVVPLLLLLVAIYYAPRQPRLASLA
ncbi:hypothetical protein KDA_62150 [Dictyobacter alpinus]|uniref:HEAT repeat domain-containing protein n=1 Tax=Dictyobacter alpinus TaxID=2014873 RepID=A0A402BH40_9CHLR|nr:HEAT repeat domain-containing protein [Dictyobacter alpinus]GCE30731.1 hypothetical protein KDA_62150 [Dictyobacter alpinus]